MKKLTGVIFSLFVMTTLFGQTFQHLSAFGNTMFNDLDEACITVADGKIFIQDEDDDDVKVFANTAPYANLSPFSFGSTQLSDSEDGILVLNNQIFVMDNGPGEIEVFDLAAPHTFTGTTIGNAEIGDPEGLATYGGLLFVSDNDDDRVEVFSATSPFTHSFFGVAEIQSAGAIAAADGKIFVLDLNEDHVEVFSATPPHAHLGAFGAAQIDRTGDAIAIGNNLIFVIDDNDNQIEVFELGAPYKHIGKFGGAELNEPECLAVSGDKVFVADDVTDPNDHIEVYQIIPPAPPIPTLSQWGLFIFSLLVLNLGLILVQRQKNLNLDY